MANGAGGLLEEYAKCSHPMEEQMNELEAKRRAIFERREAKLRLVADNSIRFIDGGTFFRLEPNPRSQPHRTVILRGYGCAAINATLRTRSAAKRLALLVFWRGRLRRAAIVENIPPRTL
jgi:hypothetical protein